MDGQEAVALALLLCGAALAGLVIHAWWRQSDAIDILDLMEAADREGLPSREPPPRAPESLPPGPEVAPWLHDGLLDDDMAVEGLHSDVVERILSDASKEAWDSDSSMPRLVIEDAACAHHGFTDEEVGIFVTAFGECEVVRRRHG